MTERRARSSRDEVASGEEARRCGENTGVGYDWDALLVVSVIEDERRRKETKWWQESKSERA